MNCPNDHGEMKISGGVETVTFRGKGLQVFMEHYVCSECAITVDDLSLGTKNQQALSDAYRKAEHMLTGDEIAEGRRRRKWTQEKLARAINVGIASIKRWEKGQIQNKAMDDALRRALGGDEQSCNPYTGNRSLSLERIKLVLQEFSARLGRSLLTKGDRLLYAAKYLWYSDTVAFRELGQSMTGATYARLPQGPQLNNYSDLKDLIRRADVSMAEPLAEHEIRIINKIVMTFPTNKSIYQASHNESAWKERKDGELIPYSDAKKITSI
jgi:putative zinc finger/helix-turn-helix YgiT family protein